MISLNFGPNIFQSKALFIRLEPPMLKYERNTLCFYKFIPVILIGQVLEMASRNPRNYYMLKKIKI